MEDRAFAYLKLFLVFGPIAGYAVLELMISLRDHRRRRRDARVDS